MNTNHDIKKGEQAMEKNQAMDRNRALDGNRAKGMLWGLIVGDAFGSPIQFSGKDNHLWITEMVACPVFNLPAGYWTDDGSMAMCIMDSYVRKGGYDLKDIGKKLYSVPLDLHPDKWYC